MSVNRTTPTGGVEAIRALPTCAQVLRVLEGMRVALSSSQTSAASAQPSQSQITVGVDI